MPTYAWIALFARDWQKLTRDQQVAFLRAVTVFVADRRAGAGFRPGLRVKKMKGHDNIWEMTWAPDGRATFSFGAEATPGEIHVIWRRIGTHDVFTAP
jgi:hypothetical protein